MTPATLETPRRVRRLHFDVGQRPFLVLFELTHACELACRHCRAESVPDADPRQLTTAEVKAVLDDLSALGAPRPRVVFTGGDPLQREDLTELVSYAARGALSVAVSPAGTPRATESRLAALREAGASAVSLSIDGAGSEAHDSFRRVDGSFAWTVAACRAAQSAGLRLQVNTTVCTATVRQLPAISRLVAELGAGLWSLFFMVPTGRGRDLSALSAQGTEDVLAFLHDLAPLVPLKTTEAPSYRRLVLHGGGQWPERAPGQLYAQLRSDLETIWPGALATGGASVGHCATAAAPQRPHEPGAPASGHRRAPLAVGDGRGVVFVSHVGDVQPSGFLPLVAGNVREAPLTAIYATSDLLKSLRDPAALRGRCGRCELKPACGGSRAQAYARLGDHLAEDPTCPYDPPQAAGAAAGRDH